MKTKIKIYRSEIIAQLTENAKIISLNIHDRVSIPSYSLYVCEFMITLLFHLYKNK
jgi:hypothetical protein